SGSWATAGAQRRVHYRCRDGRTTYTPPAEPPARQAAQSTRAVPARRGRARSPTRRVDTRRAGSSGRIRRHALARWTSREPRCVFPYDLDLDKTVFMMTVAATGAPVKAETGT